MTNPYDSDNCSTYSDLYKDANGFRPDLRVFVQLSEEDQREEIAHVQQLVIEQLAEEKQEAEISERREFGGTEPRSPFADFFGA
jgi:hypothetical protein